MTEKTKKPNKTRVVINGIVIEKILSSDNLNECVDFLLRKDKPEFKNSLISGVTLRVIRHNASGKSKEKKKRQRKNLDQHVIL
jgi:hypothetical protein